MVALINSIAVLDAADCSNLAGLKKRGEKVWQIGGWKIQTALSGSLFTAKFPQVTNNYTVRPDFAALTCTDCSHSNFNYNPTVSSRNFCGLKGTSLYAANWIHFRDAVCILMSTISTPVSLAPITDVQSSMDTKMLQLFRRIDANCAWSDVACTCGWQMKSYKRNFGNPLDPTFGTLIGYIDATIQLRRLSMESNFALLKFQMKLECKLLKLPRLQGFASNCLQEFSGISAILG